MTSSEGESWGSRESEEDDGAGEDHDDGKYDALGGGSSRIFHVAERSVADEESSQEDSKISGLASERTTLLLLRASAFAASVSRSNSVVSQCFVYFVVLCLLDAFDLPVRLFLTSHSRLKLADFSSFFLEI
ncbi:uncharacterized protein G2W53_004789 [Senna tora]|uniref:Uncharacterized protein n=1 Tax=Senna tora TaxID=362788 RepID=A0A835CIG9_9FABA|nr:uncharacterized protein G2W53_004789 [Senna tora]